MINFIPTLTTDPNLTDSEAIALEIKRYREAYRSCKEPGDIYKLLDSISEYAGQIPTILHECYGFIPCEILTCGNFHGRYFR